MTAREVLTQAGRQDLYDRFLSLLGVASFTEAQVLQYHVESIRLFDRAIQVHRSFVPGDAQLHPSYRTYLKTGVEEILEGGLHREAMWRIQRTYFPACQVLIADAAEDERPHYRTMWDAFRAHLGLSTPEHVRNRLDDGHRLAQEVRDVALQLAGA